jgi:hypothetical protein
MMYRLGCIYRWCHKHIIPRRLLNCCDFIEGLYDAVFYTYVDKGFWHESGYCLMHQITGWYDEFVRNRRSYPTYQSLFSKGNRYK